MRNKKSEWFKGLLAAESLGPEGATHAWNTHEFYDESLSFQNGVLDYLSYYKEVLKNVRA